MVNENLEKKADFGNFSDFVHNAFYAGVKIGGAVTLLDNVAEPFFPKGMREKFANYELRKTTMGSLGFGVGVAGVFATLGGLAYFGNKYWNENW